MGRSATHLAAAAKLLPMCHPISRQQHESRRGLRYQGDTPPAQARSRFDYLPLTSWRPFQCCVVGFKKEL